MAELTVSGFVLLVGVLLFNYVGFELPNSAGEEMINPQRDVPFAIARSAVGSVLLYALPVIGILKLGTPVRVNIFSGIVASIVVVLATQIYPALWKLRVSHPEVSRPFRMPLYRTLTIVLMLLVAIASVQLIAPGAGYHWFSSDFAPGNWSYGERFTYLWTELIPVLAFIAVGVLFWWLGRKTRAELADPAAAGPQS